MPDRGGEEGGDVDRTSGVNLGVRRGMISSTCSHRDEAISKVEIPAVSIVETAHELLYAVLVNVMVSVPRDPRSRWFYSRLLYQSQTCLSPKTITQSCLSFFDRR